MCFENLKYLYRTCELCNEHGHLNINCKLFHDRIVSKNCDDLSSLAHHNELTLLLGYEEMKRQTKHIPEYNLGKFHDIDLEEIYMYCAVTLLGKSLYTESYQQRALKSGAAAK